MIQCFHLSHSCSPCSSPTAPLLWEGGGGGVFSSTPTLVDRADMTQPGFIHRCFQSSYLVDLFWSNHCKLGASVLSRPDGHQHPPASAETGRLGRSAPRRASIRELHRREEHRKR